MLLFNRKCEVIFIEKGVENSILVNELRVTFKVNKTRTSSLNTATIEIYNLAKNTSDAIAVDNVKVLLKAGYGDTLYEVFKGDVIRVQVQRQSTEVITIIEALDGREAVLSKVSVGHSQDTSSLSILNNVIGVADLEVDMNSTATDKLYKNGFSYAGPTKEAFDKISEYVDVDWSIQSDKVKYIPKGESDKGPVTYLSNETGLLESPVKIGNIDPRKKKSKKITGWKVKSLLIPHIQPGNKIVIKSEMLNNQVFYVDTVDHNGDTFDNAWETELEIHEISSMKISSSSEQVNFK